MLCRATLLLLVVLVTSVAQAQQPQAIPVAQLDRDFVLIGKLHVPLGRVITIAGVMVEGHAKGAEGGPNLRVQEIQGRYYQEDIQIVLKPYFYDWGDQPLAGGSGLPKLVPGKTYEMEGYETGGYVGVPGEVFLRGGVVVQSTGHYFRHQFVVTKAKEINPIVYAPGMFEARKALLSGTAQTIDGNKAVVNSQWTVTVERNQPWPSEMEGKEVETFGFYNVSWSAGKGAPRTYDLVDGTCNLVHLADQVDKAVALRGRAYSLNGIWWFDYRGTRLYVDGLDHLPGWSHGNHARPMVIEGRLEKAMLPSLAQITLKADRDLVEHYIVRSPSWHPLPALLFNDRPIRQE